MHSFSYRKAALLTLLALPLTVVSCRFETFVDIYPPNVIAVENFYRTEADIRLAMTGLYATLRDRFGNYWLYGELPSDNVETYPESEVTVGEFDKLTWVATSGNINGLYQGHYRTIANANTLLDKIGGVAMDQTLRNRYIAETKFIRALMYVNLVRAFGGVPLVLKRIETEAEAYSFLRSPATEVYAQIEKDLTEALTGLPATGLDVGRATPGAARALLGRVYLQQKKWADAERVLAEVVSSNAYRLLPTVAEVYRPNNNAEIVFAVQYQGAIPGEGSSFGVAFLPQGGSGAANSVPAGGSSLNIGTADLYNAHEEGDARRDLIGVFRAGSLTYYYTRKFAESTYVGGAGDQDWPVIRYADVLLMLAEAQNEQNKTAAALPSVNAIRTRAKLPALANPTQASLRLAIEQERRVELAFEGHRWWDLLRYGKAISTMQAFKTRYNVAALSVAETRVLMPLPAREKALNPAFEQNPGY
jgi:starch-binding outer membrane protein, SusD/RagB family